MEQPCFLRNYDITVYMFMQLDVTVMLFIKVTALLSCDSHVIHSTTGCQGDWCSCQGTHGNLIKQSIII